MVSPAVSHRLVFADGLRAFAILLVVMSHAPIAIPHLDSELFGTWGVACFFVLSGFLLAGPYLRSLLDPLREWPSTRLFLLRRFLRIYPLYAAAVLVSCVLLVAAGQPFPSTVNVVMHLTMVHGFSAATDTTLDPPLWTMPVDVAFYLSLPVLAYALAWGMRDRSLRARVVTIGLALVTCSLLGVVARYLVCELVPAAVRDEPLRSALIGNIVGMAPAFAIGVGIALLTVLRRHTASRYAVMIAALLFAILSANALRSLMLYDSLHDPTLIRNIVIRDVVAAISVGCVVLALENVPRIQINLLMTRFVTQIAALSYAVYLFHYPILQVVLHIYHGRQGLLTGTVETLLMLGVTLAVAIPAHRYIEKPFLDLKDKRRERAAQSVPAPAEPTPASLPRVPAEV